MKTIDVTPTWTALLPAMLAVIESHEDTTAGYQASHNISDEFQRMAKAADLWNEYAKGPCGEVLWLDGAPQAICTQQMFTEHSHNDGQIHEMVEAGLARWFDIDNDVLRAL